MLSQQLIISDVLGKPPRSKKNPWKENKTLIKNKKGH